MKLTITFCFQVQEEESLNLPSTSDANVTLKSEEILDEADGETNSGIVNGRKLRKATSTESDKGNEEEPFMSDPHSAYMSLDESIYDQNVIKKLQQGRFEIKAEIIETGIVNDRGKTYGIYAVAVTKTYDSGYQDKWHIYRRYSDFYDLYQKIKDKYYDLAKIAFPGKKTFHNMDRDVLERRMVMLNSWLQQLTRPAIVEGHMGLQNLLLTFFEQGDYDKGVTGGQISRTVHEIEIP